MTTLMSTFLVLPNFTFFFSKSCNTGEIFNRNYTQTLCTSRAVTAVIEIHTISRGPTVYRCVLFLFNCLFYPYSRKKEVKLNLELSRLPQGSNTLSPTSASKTLASSPLSSTTTTTTTATTTTSPIPVNQIRR